MDAIDLCCKRGKLIALKYLLEKEWVDYRPDEKVLTEALRSAMAYVRVDVVDYLLHRGVRPGVLTSVAVITRMCETKTRSISLSRSGQCPETRYLAVGTLHEKYMHVLRNIVEHGGDINIAWPEDGTSALWIACTGGLVCLVLQLLRLGADIHVLNCMQKRQTILSYVLNSLNGRYISMDLRRKLNHIALIVISFITDWNKESWLREFIGSGAILNTQSTHAIMRIPNAIFQLLREKSTTPSCLSQLCRTCILSQLGQKAKEKVPLIGLPKRLQDYLNLDDIENLYLSYLDAVVHWGRSQETLLEDPKNPVLQNACICIRPIQKLTNVKK